VSFTNPLLAIAPQWSSRGRKRWIEKERNREKERAREKGEERE